MDVSIIDLRNAFGEADHNFLLSVLEYHHLPPHVIVIIHDLYSSYKILIATQDFVIHPVEIRRGVLQGDNLSALIFNMCFNTPLVTIRMEQIK